MLTGGVRYVGLFGGIGWFGTPVGLMHRCLASARCFCPRLRPAPADCPVPNILSHLRTNRRISRPAKIPVFKPQDCRRFGEPVASPSGNLLCAPENSC